MFDSYGRDLTPEEKELAQIDKGWVNLMYDRTTNGRPLGFIRHTGADLLSYRHCYVGDIRAKIGLSRDYKFSEYDEHCYTCQDIARDMGFWIFHRYARVNYLILVRAFLRHIKLDHNWAPNSTA